MKKLTGNTEIEDSLGRLDKLTQEEARMASAEMLKITHTIDNKLTGVDDKVKDVEGKVQDVRGDVQDVRGDVQDIGKDVRGGMQDVGNKVQGVDDRVQCVEGRVQSMGSDVKDISSEVRDVDDKLDQVNRSLSLWLLRIVPIAQTALQVINSEIVFYGGFRLQIHLSTITLHAKPITTVQLNGFFKAVYIINGSQPSPSYGYTENVRLSFLHRATIFDRLLLL